MAASVCTRVVSWNEAAEMKLSVDSDDQAFIDLAVHRRCHWLITHDRALLRLASRARPFGVQVLPPARWAR